LDTSEAREQKPNFLRKLIGWALRIGITVALFILLFYPEVFGLKGFVPVTLGGLWREIRNIEAKNFWPWIIFGIFAQATAMLSSALRWRFLLLGQGIKIRFFDLLLAFLVGRFIGIFLPGTIGQDGYKFYYVARYAKRIAESASVIIVEKITGFIALTLLVFLTLPLGIKVVNFKILPLLFILAILFFAIVFAFILLLNPVLVHAIFAALPMPESVRQKFRRFEDALSAYSHQKRYLLIALGFALVVHFATTFVYFGTFSALRAQNVGLKDILFASPLVIYGTVIGPSIGGEGIREFVATSILGAKAGSAKAFLSSHLVFWIGGIISMIGGLIFLLQGAIHKPRMIIKDLSELKREAELKGIRVDQLRVDPKAIRRYFVNWLYFGALGGAWGGAVVGLIEALIISISQKLPEHVVLGYGPLAYAIFGGVIGFAFGAIGLFISLLRLKDVHKSWPFSLGLGFSIALLAMQVAQFRIKRDLLAEHAIPIYLTLIVAACAVLIIVLLLTLFRKKLKSIDCPKLVRPLISLALLIAIGFVVGFAWSKRPALVVQAEAISNKPPIILVMVDALRADALSCYGNGEIKTPNVDALASDSVLFKTAFSCSSWTKPSTATVLTGLYPSTHGAYGKSHVLSKDVEMISEVLQRAGYLTLGIADVVHLSPAFGFDQGYNYYNYLVPSHFFYATESSERLLAYQLARQLKERYFGKKKWVKNYYQPADVVTNTAIEVLSKEELKDKSFFLYVHYMDVHDPYFRHPYDGYAIARVETPNPKPEKKDEMIKLYLGEVKYFDEHFGRLISALKETGIYDRALIVLFADHGEEFFEHSGWWHGDTLYYEQTHVPLIVKMPPLPLDLTKAGPEIVDAQASLVDVAPTILDLVGVEIPKKMQGKSLVPVITCEEREARRIFMEEDFEGNVLFALMDSEYKLILANKNNPRGLPEAALFDMGKDPLEKENLAATPYYGGVIDQKRADIDNIKLLLKQGAFAASAKELTPEEKERLKALGYIQ